MNKLTQSSTVSSGDWVVLWKTDQGDYRGVSFTDFASAVLATQSAVLKEADTVYASPGATDFYVNAIGTSPSNDVHLMLSPVAVYANGNIIFPAASTARDKQTVILTTNTTVTSIAIDLNGASFIYGYSPGAGITTSTPLTYKYDKPSNTWHRI